MSNTKHIKDPYDGLPVALLKIGHVEDHFDITYVSFADASAMVAGAKIYGWDISPIAHGYRIVLEDDPMYQFVDLLDRAEVKEALGVEL